MESRWFQATSNESNFLIFIATDSAACYLGTNFIVSYAFAVKCIIRISGVKELWKEVNASVKLGTSNCQEGKGGGGILGNYSWFHSTVRYAQALCSQYEWHDWQYRSHQTLRLPLRHAYMFRSFTAEALLVESSKLPISGFVQTNKPFWLKFMVCNE